MISLGQLANVHLRLVAIQLRSLLEFRAAFVLGAVAQFLTYGAEFAVIWLLIDRFQQVGGWSAEEVMLLFALNLTSYAIAATFFFNTVGNLSAMIETGSLDQILRWPVPPFLTLAASNVNIAYVSHLALSVSTMAIAVKRLGIAVDLGFLASLAVVIAGAALVQGAVFVLTGSLNFWMTYGGDVLFGLLWDARELVKYPLDIYPIWIQVLLTFGLPLGFITYYPAQVILGREAGGLVQPGAWGVLAVGALLFCGAYGVWRLGLRRYNSTGS